jgi:hypothetical protein
VFLILLVFSVGYDGTCHTLLGGGFACSFDKYFENDVLFSLAGLAQLILPILLTIPIVGVVLGFIKKFRSTRN